MAIDVSIVLPVYNEAGHLHEAIDRLRGAFEGGPSTFELIVVDDGSDDGSADQLAGLADIRLIRFPENRGYGAAIQAGIRAASGELIAITDADLTYPDDELPAMVKELDGYDMVVGARTAEYGSLRALRRPAKWLIRRLAEFMSGRRIADLNSGFRVFRRDVAMQFVGHLPNRFSCSTTLTMSFLASGYSLKYVPIDYAPRAGRSKFRLGSDTMAYVTQVVRLVLGYQPLRLFLPVALAFGVLATGKLGRDMLTSDTWVDGNTLLIYFAAFQLLVIGLLADLVVRRTRPRDEVPPATL